MLNRAALIVRPGPGFMKWAASLDDSGLLPDSEGEQGVYLVPQFDFLDEAQSALPRMFEEIFERELEGWCLDQATWPEDRSVAVFKEWFTAEWHTVIEDLCGDPLLDDERSG